MCGARKRTTHVKNRQPEYKEKETGIKTKVSHTPKMKVLSGDLITQIRKQLNLDKNVQVADLANCHMKKEDYIDLLIQKGRL